MVVVKEAGEYYISNKNVLKEKANSKYKSLSEKKKKQKENIVDIGTKT